jgi:hypothetical protein
LPVVVVISLHSSSLSSLPSSPHLFIPLLDFRDAVDVIGVDSYYPLGNGSVTPTLPLLLADWQPIIDRLHNLSTYWDRPVVLTEIGYCSGGCVRNANSTPEEQATQALYYQAALTAFVNQTSWFQGFFWWAWDTDNNFGGPANVCITPQVSERKEEKDEEVAAFLYDDYFLMLF